MVGLKASLFFFLLALTFAERQTYNDRREVYQMRAFKDLVEASNEDELDNSKRDDFNSRSHKEEDNVADEDEEEYLELRASAPVAKSGQGPVITLQNRALMNTRLRVLYTDAGCNPSIAETGRLLLGQTKSVTLPKDAQKVRIIVQKDLFAENWRLAYNGTLDSDANSQCVRITGTTLNSSIKKCK